MGYRSMDEFKRLLVDRMRQEVDPDKDWDSLIGVRSTLPERKESGKADTEPTSAKHTNATEPNSWWVPMEAGIAETYEKDRTVGVATRNRHYHVSLSGWKRVIV